MPRNHFSISSRFKPSNIEKISQELQQTQKNELLYYVFHHYRIYSKTGENKYVRAVQAHANGYSQQTKILIAHKQQNVPLLVPVPLSPNQTCPVN